MEIFGLILVVVAAMVAFMVQREMVTMQYTASAGGGPAADMSVVYSRRVVTPEGVYPAAVHVFNGRIQSVVPSEKPPKNAKVCRRSSSPPLVGRPPPLETKDERAPTPSVPVSPLR